MCVLVFRMVVAVAYCSVIMHLPCVVVPDDPLRYDRTYDHVIELRNVTPSTTLNDVSTLCARVLSASGGPVTFQDVRRIDDNTVIVVCTNGKLLFVLCVVMHVDCTMCGDGVSLQRNPHSHC